MKFVEKRVDRYLLVKGLIFIVINVRKFVGLMCVQIFCQEVICIGNWVFFVVLDLFILVIKEIYNCVKLLNNSVEFIVNMKNECFKDSMYIFSVRKFIVKFVDLCCVNNISNQDLRCVKIYVKEVKVVIENLLFVGYNVLNGKGGSVFIEFKLYVFLVVIEILFK